jgi:DNA-binding NtrC family response regulator
MKKVRILIVDDEHNTREALSRYLKLRFDVTTAEDGGVAIELLRHEDFDLVLTDLRMPKADGMSVLEAAAGKACRPACILLTAYGSITDAVAAVKKGAFDFVPKPVKLDKLEEVINAALEARSKSMPIDDAVPQSVKVAASPVEAEAENKLVLPENSDNPMYKVMEIVDVVAPTRSTVLLTGESGTGKEVVARLLHDRSGRTGYFVAVNCAALTPTLLESELFGHEKGAFTGANEQRKGRFERADHGTLFLDEIGEIDAATQVKLLRVLESRSFERVGGTEPIKVDIRLIAATNRDLRKMVADKEFREDLYYRLSVVNLELPPLRERTGDIPRLIDQFIKEFSADNGRSVSKVAPDALKILCEYPWPGNIRELRNCIENMVVRTIGDTLKSDVIPEEIRERKMIVSTSSGETSSVMPTLEDTEWAEIEKALAVCNGNRTRAAELLGISRRTLHRRLLACQREK